MILNKSELYIFEKISEIEKESFSNPWNMNIYKAMYEKDGNLIFLSIYQEEIVGYALISDMYDVYELLKIAIKKDFRNKGFGRILLEEIIQFCQKDIFLEVRKSNTGAINLYISKGFLQVGLRKNYYPDNNEDALVFKYEKVG
jgi:ribosomal-protein-alanine N-acetyltransferase